MNNDAIDREHKAQTLETELDDLQLDRRILERDIDRKREELWHLCRRMDEIIQSLAELREASK